MMPHVTKLLKVEDNDGNSHSLTVATSVKFGEPNFNVPNYPIEKGQYDELQRQRQR